MKQYRVLILKIARADLQEAKKWYNEQQKGLGKKLSDDLSNTLLRICANPTSFAIRYKDYRVAYLDTFPYGVHFFIDEDHTVFVTAILHRRRHPDTPINR